MCYKVSLGFSSFWLGQVRYPHPHCCWRVPHMSGYISSFVEKYHRENNLDYLDCQKLCSSSTWHEQKWQWCWRDFGLAWLRSDRGRMDAVVYGEYTNRNQKQQWTAWKWSLPGAEREALCAILLGLTVMQGLQVSLTLVLKGRACSGRFVGCFCACKESCARKTHGARREGIPAVSSRPHRPHQHGRWSLKLYIRHMLATCMPWLTQTTMSC